jgi:isochorismate hydrolase
MSRRRSSNGIRSRPALDAIEYINAAIALFRERGLPVVCVQQVEAEDGLVPGETGFEVPDHVDVLASDVHIHKTYGNAFNKTPLHAELQRLGVDTVIITGFCAEYCILATDRGARDLDLLWPSLKSAAIASSSRARGSVSVRGPAEGTSARRQHSAIKGPRTTTRSSSSAVAARSCCGRTRTLCGSLAK